MHNVITPEIQADLTVMSRKARRELARAAKGRSKPASQHSRLKIVDTMAMARAGAARADAANRDAFLAEVQTWLTALRRGEADRQQMIGLVGAGHLLRALTELGRRGSLRYDTNEPWVLDWGLRAIEDIALRERELGRFVARGEELQKIGAMLELHAAAFHAAIQSDLEAAMRLMRERAKANRGLSVLFEGVAL